MKVVKGRPPNFEEIAAVMPEARNEGTIFCYGDTIYDTGSGSLPRWLHAHEFVHSVGQGNDVEGWWRKYISDPAFRLAEEIPAHRAEYLAFCKSYKGTTRRERQLIEIAQRLAGPLYGGLIDFERAKRVIKIGV